MDAQPTSQASAASPNRRARWRPGRPPPLSLRRRRAPPPPARPHPAPLHRPPRRPAIPRAPPSPARPRRRPRRGRRASASTSTSAAASSCREGTWRVRLRDLDTGNILFETREQAAPSSTAPSAVSSASASRSGSGGGACLPTTTTPSGRDVLIQFPVGTLGDPPGLVPLRGEIPGSAQLPADLRDVGAADPAVPRRLSATSPSSPTRRRERSSFYASYCIGLFFDDAEFIWQPTDFRHVGLHRTAGYILGVDPAEMAPRIAFADDGPPIAEPYV